MDIETITKLLDAGYTKADIDAMQGSDAPSGENNEGAGEEVTPTSEKPSNAGAENESTVAPEIKALTETVNALTATVKAMQESNIKGAKTDTPSTGDEINDAMKSFIEKL